MDKAHLYRERMDRYIERIKKSDCPTFGLKQQFSYSINNFSGHRQVNNKCKFLSVKGSIARTAVQRWSPC